jgi:hypothetical protein
MGKLNIQNKISVELNKYKYGTNWAEAVVVKI